MSVSPVCYRIANIPRPWNRNHLEVALRQIDPEVFAEPLEPGNVALFPSLFGPTQTGLVNARLRSTKLDETECFPVEDPYSHPPQSVNLIIDSSFFGLTPLNDPGESPGENTAKVAADIVAVTGLAGHAFGSWRHSGTRKNWLKDFLPDDLIRDDIKVRVMTFGYDTKLKGASNRIEGVGMADHVRDFASQLMLVRKGIMVSAM